MKKTFLVSALLIMCSMVTFAYDYDAYLVGAVPTENGKVVFQKEFNLPSISKAKIYNVMQAWLKTRLAENKNAKSRIVYANPEKGVIAAVGEEYIIFKSTALSLDRALTDFQITQRIEENKCVMRIEKIRFNYDEENTPAEEWITDEVALNKDQTKIIRGYRKFRVKTVDFATEWFKQAEQALRDGLSEAKPKKEEPKTLKEEKSKTIVIGETTNQKVSPITGKPIVEQKVEKTHQFKGAFTAYNINVKDLQKSILFYQKALGLKKDNSSSLSAGEYAIVRMGNSNNTAVVQLTWLKNKQGKYNLGDNEHYLIYKAGEDFNKMKALHQQQKIIVFENEKLGFYFIADPDGYWTQIRK